MDPHESTFRAHVEGKASVLEEREAEKHMQECADCRELADFAHDLSAGIKELGDEMTGIEEAHPSSPTIVAYEEGTLDPKSALHLRAHMLFCDVCAESYYMLKRMRAQGLVEVVVGIVQDAVGKATKSLLKLIEISGPAELVPIPLIVSRGEAEEGQSNVQIAQHITDSGDEADLYYSIEPEGNEPTPMFLLRIEIEPPKHEWRAQFLDADGKELASVPLSLKSQVICSHFPEGSFAAKVEKGNELLAECRIRIQQSEESQYE